MSSYSSKPLKSLQDFIDNKKSMLDSDTLPSGYGAIESGIEAEVVAYPHKNRQVRIFIVWDNPVENFPLTEVLYKMRETGAAMVTKVEPIS